MAANEELPGIDDFIDEMVTRYGFDRARLTRLFSEVEVQSDILEIMSQPTESSTPWYEYRDIFLTPGRIQKGVAFWQEYQACLARAQAVFGVAPAIIVAILGIESNYGRYTGQYRVINALSTLAFRYPPRSHFFRYQLAEFLLLARAKNRNPLSFQGSYAGAMGMAQFMPDSFRDYAVDFNQDGRRDIWKTPEDAIGSIANYLNQKGGWQAGAPIVYAANAEGVDYRRWLDEGLKPSIPVRQLHQAGIQIPGSVPDDTLVSLFALEQEDGPQVWVGFRNFYALIRYNPSPLYAMAVYQLAEAIKAQREGGRS